MKLNFRNQSGAIILSVNVIGKEDSEGWLIAMVNFNDNGFTANFKISLMLNDLYAFIDQLKPLQKSLKGNAVFSNIEDNVIVKLSTDGIGHIDMDAVLRHSYNPDLKILFVINSDQTFLPELISECNQILAYYQPH
jgi:hypothetical protein